MCVSPIEDVHKDTDYMFFDVKGYVVAAPGLDMEHPWKVVASTKFEGRYFFKNIETEECTWSLPPSSLYFQSHVISPAGGVGQHYAYDSSTLLPLQRNDTELNSGAVALDSSSSPSHPPTALFQTFVPNISLNEDILAQHRRSEPPALRMMSDASSGAPSSFFPPSEGPEEAVVGLVASSSSSSLPMLGMMYSSYDGRSAEENSSSVTISDRSSLTSLRLPSLASMSTSSFDSNSQQQQYHQDEIIQQEANGTTVTPYCLKVLGGLGRGGYAAVVRVVNITNGKEYALKIVRKKYDRYVPRKQMKHRNQLLKELEVLTTIATRCPFMAHCHHSFENATSVFFVLDIFNGGDLYHHMATSTSVHGGDNQSVFKEHEASIILAELYLAIEHLHNHGIVHRDIKVENVMLDIKGHVKLIDFGLAMQIHEQVQHMPSSGSLLYMAPELLVEKIGGRHTDWWAYGVLAHELLTGSTPWSSTSDEIIIKHEISQGVTKPRSSLLTSAGRKLIIALLNNDFKKRIGTESDCEIKSLSFFKKIDWEKVLHLECPPAFVPGAVKVNSDTQMDSLEFYYDMIHNQKDDSDANCWYLGIRRDASTFLTELADC